MQKKSLFLALFSVLLLSSCFTGSGSISGSGTNLTSSVSSILVAPGIAIENHTYGNCAAVYANPSFSSTRVTVDFSVGSDLVVSGGGTLSGLTLVYSSITDDNFYSHISTLASEPSGSSSSVSGFVSPWSVAYLKSRVISSYSASNDGGSYSWRFILLYDGSVCVAWQSVSGLSVDFINRYNVIA